MVEEAPTSVVVDTDVFSFIFDRDRRGELYRPHLEGRLVALSFQTVAELWSGALWAHWGSPRSQRLDAEIRRYVVIPYHEEMARIWGRVVAERRQIGREIKAGDAWIAATALWADAPLLTHNHRDFTDISGLIVITEPSTEH